MALSVYSQIRRSFVAESDARSKKKFNKNIKLWKRIEIMYNRENMKGAGGSDDQIDDQKSNNYI